MKLYNISRLFTRFGQMCGIHNRCFFQYRLRNLLILTAIIAALIAHWSANAKKQRAAVTKLRDAGFLVLYDFQYRESDGDRKQTPPFWPAWLIDRIGVDYFADAVYVATGRDGSDYNLLPVSDLTSLEKIDAGHSGISDATIGCLGAHESLEDVAVCGTRITDAGLVHLENAQSIRDLDIAETQITDRALHSIASLTNLQRLRLDRTAITDVGIAYLAGHNGIEQIFLESTDITDKVFDVLDTLPRLRYVCVYDTATSHDRVLRFRLTHENCGVDWREKPTSVVPAENLIRRKEETK